MAVGDGGECVGDGRCDCAGTVDDVQGGGTYGVSLREK